MFNKLSTKINNAAIEKENSASSIVKAYYALIAVFAALVAVTVPSAALDNLFNKVSSSLKKIYSKIIGISSVIAVVFVAICLVIRMVSKNQRSVEEATSWIKRIVITWIILNSLGWFLAYGKELVAGGSSVSW